MTFIQTLKGQSTVQSNSRQLKGNGVVVDDLKISENMDECKDVSAGALLCLLGSASTATDGTSTTSW